MGYIVIKPKKGGIKPHEHITVGSGRIYISKALAERLGLHLRKKAVRLLIDSDTRALCLDFKDLGQMPDAFPVRINYNKNNSMTCAVYCAASIEDYHITQGRYRITSQDGCVYKTDCIVK